MNIYFNYYITKTNNDIEQHVSNVDFLFYFC
jgi:hypothetical protein